MAEGYLDRGQCRRSAGSATEFGVRSVERVPHGWTHSQRKRSENLWYQRKGCAMWNQSQIDAFQHLDIQLQRSCGGQPMDPIPNSYASQKIMYRAPMGNSVGQSPLRQRSSMGHSTLEYDSLFSPLMVPNASTGPMEYSPNYIPVSNNQQLFPVHSGSMMGWEGAAVQKGCSGGGGGGSPRGTTDSCTESFTFGSLFDGFTSNQLADDRTMFETEGSHSLDESSDLLMFDKAMLPNNPPTDSNPNVVTANKGAQNSVRPKMDNKKAGTAMSRLELPSHHLPEAKSQKMRGRKKGKAGVKNSKCKEEVDVPKAEEEEQQQEKAAEGNETSLGAKIAGGKRPPSIDYLLDTTWLTELDAELGGLGEGGWQHCVKFNKRDVEQEPPWRNFSLTAKDIGATKKRRKAAPQLLDGRILEWAFGCHVPNTWTE